LLLADGQRIGLESTYLPRHRFGQFNSTFDPTTSLYAAIRATGVQFGSAVERVETVTGWPSRRCSPIATEQTH
jgi:GntR family transcriptional regulator